MQCKMLTQSKPHLPRQQCPSPAFHHQSARTLTIALSSRKAAKVGVCGCGPGLGLSDTCKICQQQHASGCKHPSTLAASQERSLQTKGWITCRELSQQQSACKLARGNCHIFPCDQPQQQFTLYLFTSIKFQPCKKATSTAGDAS
eukprot:1158913-Pelagomonas_calceolata.AAC.1